MYCKQCGKMMLGDAKFCGHCGAAQTIESNNMNNQPSNVQPQVDQSYNQTQNPVGNAFSSYQANQSVNQTQYSNSYVNNEEEVLLKEYVGPAYEAINRSSFSLPSFFLLPFYFLYRKMYLYGILLFILLIFTAFIPIVGTVVSLGCSIFFGLKFKDVYFKFARKKVNEIACNNHMSFDQKIQFCRKQGGTSIVLPILIPFSLPVIMLVLTPIIVGSLGKSYTVGDYSVRLPKSIEILEQETNSMKFTYEIDDVNLVYSIEYVAGNIESAKEEFSTGSNADKITLLNRKTIDGKEYVTYNMDVYGQKTGVVAIELDDNHTYIAIVTDKTSNTDIQENYFNLFYRLKIKSAKTS